MKRIHTPLFVVLVSFCLATSAWGQTSLSYSSPIALPAGQTVEVTLFGAKLEDPLRIWTNFPANIDVIPELDKDGKPKPTKDRKSIRCRITVAKNTPLGIGGIVAASASGASDALLLLIDDLPTTPDNGANHTLATAQEITLPTGVAGASDGVKFDFYKFTAKAGQTVSAEVWAARLGYGFDPVLRILDASGKELAFADDTPGLDGDVQIRHAFKAAGVYTLEVRDVRYRGGAALRYRLRVGDFPIGALPFPLGAPAGKTTAVAFTSLDGAKIEPFAFSPPPAAIGALASVSAKFAGGGGSALTRVLVSDLSDVVEKSPNNTAEQATPATIPCALDGRLSAAGEQDFYRISAKKGDLLRFSEVTRSLGSSAVLFMRLFDAKGKKLAEVGNGSGAEQTLSYTVPADGEYVLSVQDLLQRGGSEYGYRVEVREGPGFSLFIKNDKNARIKFITHPGGAVAVVVDCQRFGYDGPITLALDGPLELMGPAYRVFNNVIPAKGARATMLIKIPDTLPPGALSTLSIVGRGAVGDRQISARLSTTQVLQAKRPAVRQPPTWLTSLIRTAVAPVGTPFFVLKPDREKVYLVKSNKQTVVNLAFDKRHKDFKSALTILVGDLPVGLTSAVKKVGKDKDEHYEITFTATDKVALGPHQVEVLSFGDFQGKGRLQKTVLPVSIVQPIVVSATVAGPLTQGGRQKVRLSVKREFATDAEKQTPLTLQFQNLPAAVTGPGQISVTAPSFEIEVELAAAAGAKVGVAANVVVEATATFGGQKVAVKSSPIQLNVVAPAPKKEPAAKKDAAKKPTAKK